jgi:hypothetical protein
VREHEQPDVERTQAALIAAIEREAAPNVVGVVRQVSRDYAPSLVKEAYWELVSDGRISTDSAGNIRLLAGV